jgi:hypothetical protein
MKTKLFFLIFLLTGMTLYAQNEEVQTLFNKNIDLGYGGSLVTKVGKINNETTLIVGGRGMFLMDHAYSVGLGFYGLSTNTKALVPDPNDITSNRMGMGYGGLELEYIISSNNLVHFTIQTLVGGGGVGYFKDWRHNNYDNNNDYYHDNEMENIDGFFIFEPGVNIELNVVDFFRLGIGGSYRVVSGLSSALSTNSDLSGLSGFLTLKFGKF